MIMEIIKNTFKFILALLAGMAIGVVIGGAIVALFTDTTFAEFVEKFYHVDFHDVVWPIVVAIGSFIVSVFILITVHEAGHLFFGLRSGYGFVSFRIFDFVFIREDGRIRVKRFSVAGTGGQCLLSPPDLPVKDIPMAMYNAGGVIFNIVALVVAAPFLLIDASPLVKEAIVVFMFTDIFIILLNGIPMKMGGISNDAYNMLKLNDNLPAKRGIVMQLRANALIQQGVRPKDMPEELFVFDEPVDYTNPLEVAMPMMLASRYVDNGEIEKAHEIFQRLHAHSHEIMPLYAAEIASELAFTAMCLGDNALAESLLDKKLLKMIDTYSAIMSSKLRIKCAIELYLHGDRAKALAIYDDLLKRRSRYLLQGEVASDLAIMHSILNK